MRICNENISALIGTGSDISLMREKQYKAIGSPKVISTEIKFRGSGSEENKTRGKFLTEIEIGGIIYIRL